MSLYCDASGDIWVGTWGDGLNKVVIMEDFSQKAPGKEIEKAVKFISYKHYENDRSSICGNSIYSIFEDRTRIIWVGSDYNGLSKI